MVLMNKRKQFCISLSILSIVCIIFLFFFSGSVSAKELQVGVSPLVLDLGTLEKGESVVGSFFIVTSSQDELVVKLKSSRSNFDFFRKPENVDIVNYVSEEDSSKWVYFPENPYVFKSTNESLNIIKSGTISGWKRVNFILNVPEDAEPCYHSFKIEPTPYAAKDQGNTVSIIAITAITVKFMVEGECDVSGNILDMMQDSSSEHIDIEVYFQNTGTATLSLFSPEVMIFYENGTLLDKTHSGYIYVRPGEIGVLDARFNPDKIFPGDYILNSTVVYGANVLSKQVAVSIEEPRVIEVSKSSSQTIFPATNYNFLIFFIVILVMAFLVYRKK